MKGDAKGDDRREQRCAENEAVIIVWRFGLPV